MRAVLGGVLGLGVLAYAVSGAWTNKPDAAASVVPKPADAQPMVVTEVLTGDTVVLTSEGPGPQVQGWGLVTAMLIGLDSPNFGLQNECFAIEAQGRLRELLPEGSIAWVTTDVTRRDASGRWLMYIWTSDGQFVNYLLAADGFVRAKPSGPNIEHYPVIEVGADLAFRRAYGLWSGCR